MTQKGMTQKGMTQKGMTQKGSHTEILSGFHPVREALRSGRRRFEKLLVVREKNGGRLSKIMTLAETRQILVETLTFEAMEKLTRGARHQGVAARVSPLPMMGVDGFIKGLKEKKMPMFLLVIENLEDPHNLGALIRTALCAGVDAVFLPKDRAVSLSPSVSRASAGAMEHAGIVQVTNSAALLKKLKKMGFWVAGLDAAGTTPLFQSDLTGDLALVIGGEHKGIRPLVQKECDFLISLPIMDQVTSLNASVAGGIAMYEALRQRIVKI